MPSIDTLSKNALRILVLYLTEEGSTTWAVEKRMHVCGIHQRKHFYDGQAELERAGFLHITRTKGIKNTLQLCVGVSPPTLSFMSHGPLFSSAHANCTDPCTRMLTPPLLNILLLYILRSSSDAPLEPIEEELGAAMAPSGLGVVEATRGGYGPYFDEDHEQLGVLEAPSPLPTRGGSDPYPKVLGAVEAPTSSPTRGAGGPYPFGLGVVEAPSSDVLEAAMAPSTHELGAAMAPSLIERCTQADEMDNSGPETSSRSPFQQRRKAQIALMQEAFKAFWPHYPYDLTDRNAKLWLGLCENSARELYQELEEIARRKPDLQSPIAYVEKALRGRAERSQVVVQKPRAFTSSTAQSAPITSLDAPSKFWDGELLPPSEEYKRKAAIAREVAASVWGK